MLVPYSRFLAYITCTPDTPNFWTSSVKTPGSDSMRHQFPASDILRWFEILKSWEWSDRKRLPLSHFGHIFISKVAIYLIHDQLIVTTWCGLVITRIKRDCWSHSIVEGGKTVIRDESWMILAQCSRLLLFLLLLLFLCCLGLGLSLLVLLNQLIHLKKRKC